MSEQLKVPKTGLPNLDTFSISQRAVATSYVLIALFCAGFVLMGITGHFWYAFFGD
jgi:hypothetical protein